MSYAQIPFPGDHRMFRNALLLSGAFHVALLVVTRLGVHAPQERKNIEIDLRYAVSAIVAPRQVRPAAAVKSSFAPPVPQKAWSTEEQRPSAPDRDQPTVPAISAPVGEKIGAEEYRSIEGLTHLPHIIDAGELYANLKRFYPYMERVRRNEGVVTLELRINAQGQVTAATVVRSAGHAFDEAAKEVSMLLKFHPAEVDGHAVAVKLRQSIAFKLEN